MPATSTVFRSACHRDAYERVRDVLREAFGDMAVVINDAPALALRWDGALVVVRVEPWTASSNVASVFAIVALEVPESAELGEFLLKENQALLFGAYGANGSRITVEDTLIAEEASKAQLTSSVRAVGHAAATGARDITCSFGGVTLSQYSERRCM